MLNESETLSVLLRLMRDGKAIARPELQRVSGLGRGLVAERVGQLLRARVIVEGDLGASTGGRAARELRLDTSAGSVLVAYANLNEVALGIADLNGDLVASTLEAWNFGAGPEHAVVRIERAWSRLVDEQGQRGKPVWAVGFGVPAHVDFETGALIDSPSLPLSWKGFDLRRALTGLFGAPAWIDTNDNLLALGEMRSGHAGRHRSFVYVVADMAIGSGLVLDGQPFRGCQGAAGNIGHIRTYGADTTLCRCGRRGCLEAVASGEALLRQATRIGETEPGTVFAELLQARGRLSLPDIADAARGGDRQAIALLSDAGHRLGETLASVVNVVNPGLIVVGGCLPATGDLFMAAVKEALYRQSLPFVTRDLQVVEGTTFERLGLVGTAYMAVDQLFSPAMLSDWLPRGSPVAASSRGQPRTSPGRSATATPG